MIHYDSAYEMLLLHTLGASILQTIQSTTGYLAVWDEQETSGDIANADNIAVALGRNVALLTYADYTAGANWSNPSGQVARHTAGATATLQQDGILGSGRTYQAKITVSNRTAGSVTITDGGAAIDANGQAIRTITATQANFIITPTSDFDGDIDVSVTLVQQTDILESSVYPGAEELSTAGDGVMDADNWSAISGAVLTNPSTDILRVAGVADANYLATQNVLSVGPTYNAAGQARGTGGAHVPRVVANNINKWVGTNSADWQDFNVDFTTTGASVGLAGGGASATDHVEFRNLSVKPANPLNGDHTAVAVGQTGQYRIPIMAEYDGALSQTDKTSTEYNSIYTSDEFTRAVVMRKTTWDATERWLFQDWVDANNFIGIRDSTTVGTIEFVYKTGGVEKVVSWVSGSPTGSNLLDLSVSGGVMEGRVNGVSQGTIAIGTAIVGNFAVNMLGAENDGTNVHLGFLAYDQHYSTKTTDAEMARVANSMGIP
jgi:hypothetical protein